MKFEQFFQSASGTEPFPYQKEWATQTNLSELLHVPTGSGKTATVILGWLWRRFFASAELRANTPRRLVYCLPMRVLVEQTRDAALEWRKKLDLDVPVHVLMGGESTDEWDLSPTREAILIGTQDMLLSRAMNRGFGMSRYRWPMHYALLSSDCLWVMDEIQLMGNGLATSTQLQGFRESMGSYGKPKTVWMSATLQTTWLRSVDYREQASALTTVALSDADYANVDLGRRYRSIKPISPLSANFADPKSVVDTVKPEHQWGSMTLIVVNTVDRAQKLYEQLQKVYGLIGKRKKNDPEPSEAPDIVLLHSRYRPGDRAQHLEKILHFRPTAGSNGLIVVATQVIEAGVDLSCQTLVTELAPWPSLVQRFGRCNRRGDHEGARILWLDIPTAAKGKKSFAPPYEEPEMNAARSLLIGARIPDVGPVHLDALMASLSEDERQALFPYEPSHVIRRKDFIELFDTTPDLTGNDLDIGRYIRDDQVSLDVQVHWRDNSFDNDAPCREELCTVPLPAFRDFLKGKGKTAYRWDVLEGKWLEIRGEPLVPGQIYRIESSHGGYDPLTGWDGKTKTTQPVPAVVEHKELEANDDEPLSKSDLWLSIAEHTQHVVDQVIELAKALDLSEDEQAALKLAARWHDRGKGHSVMQDAVDSTNKDGEVQRSAEWADRRDIGKAPDSFWQRYARKGFRHELASALALLDPSLSESLVPDAQLDLVAYLVAAHHGKVRLSIRSLPGEADHLRSKPTLFARGIWQGDEMQCLDLGGGVEAPQVQISLQPMVMGSSEDGRPSWTERMTKLRDRIGPLRLAFLETVLRVADMRASRAEAEGKGDDHA